VLADVKEEVDVEDNVDIEITLLYGDPVECISTHLSPSRKSRRSRRAGMRHATYLTACDS
jgi:hypothetical protein